MKITKDFCRNVSILEITDEEYLSVDSKDPESLYDLIIQLSLILIKEGNLPIYSSDRSKIPHPFIAKEDKDPDVPTRVVVG